LSADARSLYSVGAGSGELHGGVESGCDRASTVTRTNACKRVKSANALVEVDHFGPVRPRIDPANAAAFRTFQVRADIWPRPFGKAIERNSGVVPAPLAWIANGRANAVDQNDLNRAPDVLQWPS
jgi:hypothetical protein